MAYTKQHIIDFLKGVNDAITSTPPQFIFEKWIGAAKSLTQQDLYNATKGAKYPVTFVLLDITENRWVNNTNFVEYPNLSIYFIVDTDITKDASWRLENSFKNRLIPISEVFYLNLIKTDAYKYANNKDKLNYSYTERYFNGTQTNEPIDAIEIQITNLRLKLNNYYCTNN